MNLEIINNNNGVKVTSLQVLEVLKQSGKNVYLKKDAHSDIMKKARKMMEELEGKSLGNFTDGSYLDKNNQPRPMIEFSKRGAIQFMASYDALLMDKLMDYIEYLESELKLQKQDSYMIDNPIERAERWIEEAKEKQLLQENNVILLEENNKWESLLGRKNVYNFKELSKFFNSTYKILPNGKPMGRNNLLGWMREDGILMYNNEPYQNYSKYFKVILGTYNTTLIYNHGIKWLTKRIEKKLS